MEKNVTGSRNILLVVSNAASLVSLTSSIILDADGLCITQNCVANLGLQGTERVHQIA